LTERFASWIAELALRRSRAILWIAAVLAALALAGATLLRFDPDILNLVPQQNREVNDFRRVLSEIGTIDYHVAVVRVPPGRQAGEYEELIDALGDGLAASDRIENATWRLPDPIDFLDELLPVALLFLDPGELESVAAKLDDDAIRESAARNRALLQTPQSGVMENVIRYDPFNLLPIYLERFRRAGGGLRIDTASGYYLSEDQTTYLVLTKPVRPAQDVPFGRELMNESRRIANEALDSFAAESPGQIELPRIEFTGGYAISTSDADLIQKDVVSNILFSFFGVLALFLYGFRRLAAIGYAGIPMALALALTFGIAGIAYGTLSSAAAGFAALLAGLGIDFNTVLYGRYVDERNRGAAMPEALRQTLRTTLPSVILAALTTSVTFFAFLLTDFRGMTQMGLLTGIGILLFFFCVAFVLPALIVANEGKSRRRKPPTLYHHSFRSGQLIAWAVRHPRTVLWVWIVFITLALLAGTRIRFSDNIQNLRASGNPGVETQELLTSKFGQSFNSMMFVSYGATPDEALDATAAVIPGLDALVADGTIDSYQSIASYIPVESRQRAAIDFIRTRPSTFDPDRVENTFRQSVVAEGFRPETWDDYLVDFRQALTPVEPVEITDLLARTAGVANRFLQQSGEGWMSVAYLNPSGGKWPREVPDGLRALQREHPDSILTGVNLVSQSLRTIVRADAIRATGIGTIAVFLLMFIGFRRVGVTVLTFVPFLAGAAGMVGLMATFGLELNFMNVFVGLMIVGVATDYAIYMLKRWLEDHDMFVDGAAAETAKAIAMAAVTTIVGYGSFALSHYPGLRSIGYASTFGIALSALATITLLPAILTLYGKRLG
jgi:uncharacterized protein